MAFDRNNNQPEEEVAPMVTGCATLISAAACGMVLLMVLVIGAVLLLVNPYIAADFSERATALPGLTAFVLSIPWWLTLLVGLAVAGLAVIKELAISHALANFIINLLLLVLLLGFAVMTAVALIMPYIN